MRLEEVWVSVWEIINLSTELVIDNIHNFSLLDMVMANRGREIYSCILEYGPWMSFSSYYTRVIFGWVS